MDHSSQVDRYRYLLPSVRLAWATLRRLLKVTAATVQCMIFIEIVDERLRLEHIHCIMPIFIVEWMEA